MAELKVSFVLSENDVTHLKRAVKAAGEALSKESQGKIAKEALQAARDARALNPPEYVLDRISILEDMASMLHDPHWSLPSSAQAQARSALAYFVNPRDIIPDTIPVLGFLDDAVVIEIVSREFEHELKGYREFCKYRDSAMRRFPTFQTRMALEKALAQKRKKIRARIQSRKQQNTIAPKRSRFFGLF